MSLFLLTASDTTLLTYYCVSCACALSVASSTVLIVGGVGCNLRLQEMMQAMVDERLGGSLCAMDNRYCVDNGAMIAQAGIFAYQMNSITPMHEATCTQR